MVSDRHCTPARHNPHHITNFFAGTGSPRVVLPFSAAATVGTASAALSHKPKMTSSMWASTNALALANSVCPSQKETRQTRQTRPHSRWLRFSCHSQSTSRHRHLAVAHKPAMQIAAKVAMLRSARWAIPTRLAPVGKADHTPWTSVVDIRPPSHCIAQPFKTLE